MFSDKLEAFKDKRLTLSNVTLIKVMRQVTKILITVNAMLFFLFFLFLFILNFFDIMSVMTLLFCSQHSPAHTYC